EFRVHKRLRHEVVRGVPYPGGVGGPTARSAPYRSCSCLASIFSKYMRNLDTEIFRKKHWRFFGGRSGVPPVVAPEGGLALPRVKPDVPQCLCASEPPRVHKVPKK